MNVFDEIKYPPKEFSPSAFWFWYGTLNPDKLRRQIGLMAEQGVYNGFMHPRAYLKTPYLENEWWEAISACVDEGEKRGFYPWIYDEYAWPSGTAGSTFEYGHQKPSRTLANGRKNMGKSLILHRFSSASEFKESVNADEDQSLLCLFAYDGSEFRLVDDIDAAEGEIVAFYVRIHTTLVDYLNKETIREFIDYTHNEYKKRYGKHFGSRIPGVFFDEIYLNNFVPWTDRLPEEFEARRGYGLMPRLYALAIEGGESEREVRRDFYKTVAELYEEAFFVQIGEWCEKNCLKLTGHTEEELLFHPSRQGNYFNTMRNLQIPGADCHDYRYRFPRKITYREPKLAVSVSRVCGKERAMSEAFGGAGWACTLQEFKRGVNTAGAMGISMFTLHGFYSDIDSQASQSDWSGNFFYQNPYWRYFKHFSDYISRICYVNSQGMPVVDVGLYYPIEEMQGETYIKGITKKGRAIDAAFNTVLNSLIENQIDVDMIDGESLLKGEISEGRLSVGNESFSVLLLPDCARLSDELSGKLDGFELAGGKVIYYSTQKESELVSPEEIHNAIAKETKLDVRVVSGERDDLYVNHRKIENKEFYFIANSSPRSRELTLLLREKGFASKLSPENAEGSAVDHRVTDEGTFVDLFLDKDEGVWIVIDVENASLPYGEEKTAGKIAVSGEWKFLPLTQELDREKQIAESRTTLEIPLAYLSSSLHGGEREIRIQNRAGEDGYIGRHLSLWNASWITRRVGWKDSSDKNKLYFRRSFSLDKKPDGARICLAAINQWRLYVNGEEVSSSSEGGISQSIDISEYLREGENVVCIDVYNPTPMPKATLLQRDELIAELMISLIAEIEMSFGGEKRIIGTDSEWIVCESAAKDWLLADFKPTVAMVDVASRTTQAPAIKATEWSFAWERGKPPLKPFGDLPLFDKLIEYPQRVSYDIELPSGTAAVRYPSVSGDKIGILIDGKPASFENGVCTLVPDGNVHYMRIELIAYGEKDGLHSPVLAEMISQEYKLGDWREHGLKWYSGFASYKNSFEISKKTGRYMLDLGQVCHQAEVWINGKKAGERVWAPYSLDITELLKDGSNEIAVIVSNSAGVWRQYGILDEGRALGWNRYWNFDNIQRESEKLVSGLIGPVNIFGKI